MKKLEEANEAYRVVLKEASDSAVDKMVKEELTPRIEKFAMAAATTIHEQFKEQIKESARVEVADALITSIAESASKFKLAVDPESKSVLDEMHSKIADLSARLETQIDEKTAATKELNQIKSSLVFESVVKELSDIKKEALKEAVNKVDYVNDEQYKTAITTIKESYFPKTDKTDKTNDASDDKQSTVTESAEDQVLANYLATMKSRKTS